MHPESYEEMSRLVAKYLRPDQRLRVLDIGSCDVNGTYRPLFNNNNWVYEGADMHGGPNVDHVLSDPYQLTFHDETFEVIISGQVFEHIKFFWLTWKEMVRVLKPEGIILLIAPAFGVEHRYPVDCWRFYPDGFEALGELEELEVLEVETRWTNRWGDTVGAFRKPAIPRKEEPHDFMSSSPASAEIKSQPSSPIITEAEYAFTLGMSVADWIIYHQESIVFDKVLWMGNKVLKNPLDCWIYQEILWKVRPDILVEIGSYAGGSTMYFCHLFDLIGQGTVISVDIDRSFFQISHPRLVKVTGNCLEPSVAAEVASLCAGKTVMVVHDADHSKKAVLHALRLYSGLVSSGSYFIIEDGIVDLFQSESTLRLGWMRPGPLAAIKEFLEEEDRFTIDKSCERYLITYNPCGFLKRVK